MKHLALPRGHMKSTLGSAIRYKGTLQGVWTTYDSTFADSHGITIGGGGKRYPVRILDNPHFCPPEVIGKRICWIALQINELGARLYRMTYGSLP